MPMKQFSTRVLSTLSLSIALALGAALPEPATAQARHDEIHLAADAPDHHTVIKGDTLWGIAGLFLKEPWRWPEIWQLNKAEIRNPHLIYPGDIVYLDRSGATPRLRLGRSVGGSNRLAGRDGGRNGNGISRLEPTVRATRLDNASIPSISLASIQSFINRPLVVEDDSLKNAPRILASREDGRINLGNGDYVYARGIPAGSTTRSWHVYRPAKPLVDPVTRKTLALESMYLGTVDLERGGDIALMKIRKLAEEITDGDRLIEVNDEHSMNFVPRAPEVENLAGHIVSIYRGVSMVGRNSVVAVNLGSKKGIENGHVLKIEHTGRTVKDRETGESVRLPNEEVGQLMIFRTFNNVAYGLIVKSDRPISIGDMVTNP